jgi:hypothetical protein
MFYDLTKIPVTLETFCDKEAVRHGISLPFLIDGYVYATDSRIAVRVPRHDYHGPLAADKTELPRPRADRIGWEHAVDSWGPVPEPEACDHCDNRRVVGYTEYDGEPDDNLLVRCSQCVVVVQGVRLRWHLVEPLTRFAGAELECGVEREDPQRDQPVHFRWPGGEALVMPLNKS